SPYAAYKQSERNGQALCVLDAKVNVLSHNVDDVKTDLQEQVIPQLFQLTQDSVAIKKILAQHTVCAYVLIMQLCGIMSLVNEIKSDITTLGTTVQGIGRGVSRIETRNGELKEDIKSIGDGVK